MSDTPETAYLTADVVLIGTGPDGRLHVLLIERRWDPFAGQWALPGGHLDPGERPAAAAYRELAEETGLRVPELRYLHVYTEPGRDPRGRYVTFAYTTTLDCLPDPVAAADAARAVWWPADQLHQVRVAFDHDWIIRAALLPHSTRTGFYREARNDEC